MRKTLLKLFLMACFLAVFSSKDVRAANDFDVGEGSIYIGDDIVGYGTSADTVKENKKNNNNTYNVSGTAVASGTKIIVDFADDTKEVYLNFTQVTMQKNSSLEIRGGRVHITLKGNSYIYSDNGDAVTITGNSRLYFTASSPNNGTITLMGGTNKDAVKGGGLHIQNGTVTLTAGNGGNPFEGSYISLSAGILKCHDSFGQPTTLGKGDLTQIGGTVIADGLATIDYENEKIQGLEAGADYKVTIGTDVRVLHIDASGKSEQIPSDWFGKTLKITLTDVGSQDLLIPPRGAAPTSPVGENEEIANTTGGKITGLTTAMEYSANNQTTWQNCTLESLEKLNYGDYYIRYRYKSPSDDEDGAFASNSKKITIKRGRILSVETPEFPSVKYGYSQDQATAMPITIKKHIVDSVKITDLRLDSANFTNNFQNNVTISTDTNNSFTIQPKTGLDAGTYTAKLTIVYEDDISGTDGYVKLEPTVTFTVDRADQKGPADFSVELEEDTVTYNSVKVKSLEPSPDTKAVAQYRVDEGNWQTSNEFKNLSPNTDHKFEARYSATTNYNASPAISTVIRTEKAATILYDSKELDVISGREYEISAPGISAKKYTTNTGQIAIDNAWYGKTLTIKDSKSTQTLKVPSIPATPTPKSTDETISGAHDGKITGLRGTMEYRIKVAKNSWSSWNSITGSSLEELAPGTYEIRTAATTSSFASNAATIIIAKGRMLDVTITDFEDMVYGTDPVSRVITIENLDKNDSVNIEGITVASNAFTITDGDKTIEASKVSDTWKVQPKAKLDVDTYTAELTVTYKEAANTASDNQNPDNQEPDNQEPAIQALSDEDGEGVDNEDSEDQDTGNQDTDDQNPDDQNTGDQNPDNQNPGDQNTDDQNPDDQNPDDQNPDSGDDESEEVIESKTVTVPVEVKVVKAEQDAPPVPTEKSKTATSITLETIPNSPISGAKAQYSKDGGRTWQDSPTFTGLSANRDYTFVARYAETDNYNASEISAGEVTITTAEKNDTDSDGVKSQDTNSSNGSNGTNGNGSNSNGTTGTNGTNSTNGSSSGSGSGSSDGTTSGVLSSAKTGDLNNIQLWVALMIGSYLSCAIIIKSRLKKA